MGGSPATAPGVVHPRTFTSSLPGLSHIQLQQGYGKLPLGFEPNEGQADPQVQFLARGSGYTLFVTAQEAVLSLKKPNALSRPLPGKGFHSKILPIPIPDTTAPTVLRLSLEGAQTNPAFETLEQLPGISNYFIGKDPAHWHTRIPQYSKVAARGLYPGVDMVYYGNQGKLEYDFVVQPGADPGAIHMKVDGAQDVQVNGQGDMELTTARGKVVLRAPSVYQQVEGQKNTLEGSYRLEEGNRVGFEVKYYDRSKPLVIDPVLDYSTYLGGSGDDFVQGIAVDAGGDAYLTGETYSPNFPTTPGAAQTVLDGSEDVFVTKLNASGTALVYSTYLGGSNGDEGNGIAVDGNGYAYVTGYTESTDFPTTSGAYLATYGGGTSTAFILRLNPSGTVLAYSTYLGGSGWDEGWAIALDSGADAYITGMTQSTNFPTTTGAYQPALAGSQNAFVAKLNTGLSGNASLVYSTYLGGNGGDFGYGIAVDSYGNAYVTGMTDSTHFPTTTGAYQTALAGIGLYPQNAFVAKLNPAGMGTADLVYSTYLGGNTYDMGSGIALDSAGNAYVTGMTQSTNFPTTAGAYQTTPGGGGDPDAFVTKLNPAGAALAYSTYLGGNNYDEGRAIAVDPGGNAYVTGLTDSTNFPTTTGAYQTTLAGGGNAFITQLNPAGTALAYSTFLGGSDFDQGYGIALDTSGNIYVTGVTNSNNFPTTAGVYQSALGGSGATNVFIAKFSSDSPTPTPTATGSPTNTSSMTVTPTVTSSPTSSPAPASMSFCYSTQWGGGGSGNGQFGSPSGIGVNPGTGDVYVCDYDYGDVQEFTPAGTFIARWGTTGTANGQFEAANGLYVDNNGNVFVVEAGGNRVQEFNIFGS